MSYSITSVEAEELGFGYTEDDFNEISLTDYFGETKELVIPEFIDGKRVVGIQPYFSNDNETIETLTILGCLDYIDMQAFSGCKNLKTLNIKLGVRELAKDAFKGCGIPVIEKNGVIYMEANENPCCIALGPNGEEESIHLTLGSKIVVRDAFRGSNITEMRIGSAEFVGSFAFSDCKKLKIFTTGLYPYYIGCDAFNGCKNLETVLIHNISIFHENLFKDCVSLNNVVLKEPLMIIKSNAFCNCKKLTYLLLPQSVITIEADAFLGCDSLETIKYQGNLESSVSFNIEDIDGNSFTVEADDLEFNEYGNLAKYINDQNKRYSIKKMKKVSADRLKELREKYKLDKLF